MAGFADELRKLAALKRNRRNFETIQETVTNLKEHGEKAADVLEALSGIREAADELESALDGAGDDNPLLEWTVDAREALEKFRAELPGNDDGEDVSSLIDELDSACDEYGDAQDDRDYTAENRDEIWGQICDALENVANAS